MKVVTSILLKELLRTVDPPLTNYVHYGSSALPTTLRSVLETIDKERVDALIPVALAEFDSIVGCALGEMIRSSLRAVGSRTMYEISDEEIDYLGL